MTNALPAAASSERFWCGSSNGASPHWIASPVGSSHRGSHLSGRGVLAVRPDEVAGWHLKPSAISLFENEYQLPLIDPTIAATYPPFPSISSRSCLLLGSQPIVGGALLCMTAVIEIFVYPGAWPTHGVWATVFLS